MNFHSQSLRKEFKQNNSFCASTCCTQEEGKNKTRVAVKCLSLSVEPGEVLGLLGTLIHFGSLLKSTNFFLNSKATTEQEKAQQ